MVQINFAQKQVNAKIVYYGPGMSGKTTNLEVIHQRAPESNRGDLTSISTDGDRTLFFDFMPLDLGTVAGMRTCFQVYTVPGQVYYNSTRKLVLQGVDGVIFIADSSPDMMEENLESMRNLEENLSEYGREAEEIPLVIQYNKRDIPGALPIEELEQKLNTRGVPAFEGIANTGQGVFPTLKAVAAAVLDSLHRQSGGGGSAPATPAPQAAPAAAAAAPAPQAAAPVPAPQAAAPAPAPTPPAQPAVQPAAAMAAEPAEDRQTISMSQTGFHKAPSMPLQGAAAPEPAPEPAPAAAAPDANGLQLKTPEPAAAGGLQLAQPAKAQSPPPMSPAMQQPAAAPQPVQQQPMAQPMQQPAAAQRQAAPAAGGTLTAPQASPPSSVSAVMGVERGATPTPRRAPTSKTIPSRSQPAHATPRGGKKKSAALTAVIVVASVGLGAALGSFVLSIL